MSGPEKKEAKKEEKSAGGGSKKLVLVLAATNVLALGGLGASMVLRAPNAEAGAVHAAPEPEGAKKEAHAEKKEEPKKEGEHAEKKEGGEHGEAKKEGAPGEAKKDEKPGNDTEAIEDLGPTTTLGSFVVTLNDPAVVRYLKMDLKAEVSKPDVADELRKREAQLRDLLISYLSSLTLRETQGAQAKEEIRLNLQRRINDVLKTGQVTRIFITDFVTQ